MTGVVVGFIIITIISISALGIHILENDIWRNFR